MSDKPKTAIFQKLLQLYKDSPGNYIGEPITQKQHAEQAAFFAMQLTDDPHVIIAALLHDVGHLLEGEQMLDDGSPILCERMWHEGQDYGVSDHAELGSVYLEACGINRRVADLVCCHATAKRFLVSVDANYMANLSAASRRTLEFQGGVMDEEEIQWFRAHPLYKEILWVRDCDDKAKLVNFTPPLRFEDYESMFCECLC